MLPLGIPTIPSNRRRGERAAVSTLWMRPPNAPVRRKDDVICRPGSTKSGTPLAHETVIMPYSTSPLSNPLKKEVTIRTAFGGTEWQLGMQVALPIGEYYLEISKW